MHLRGMGSLLKIMKPKIIENDEPLTYTEAVMSRDSDRWLQAMESEMDSMYVNQVWTLVDAPEVINPLNANGSIRKRLKQMGKSKPIKPD